MAVRQQQKQETRRRLVEAALALSARDGFASLSLREVAKTAGLTPAAFYRHFHTMEELGLVLIDEVGVGLRQLLRDARRSFEMKSGAVRRSIEVFVDYVVGNPHLFRLLLGERQGSSAEFRRAIHAELERFIGDLAEDLERGSRLLRQPIDTVAAAEAIVAITFTVGAEALDLPKHRRGDLVDRLTRMTTIVLRGARVEPAPTARTRKPKR